MSSDTRSRHLPSASAPRVRRWTAGRPAGGGRTEWRLVPSRLLAAGDVQAVRDTPDLSNPRPTGEALSTKCRACRCQAHEARCSREQEVSARRSWPSDDALRSETRPKRYGPRPAAARCALSSLCGWARREFLLRKYRQNPLKKWTLDLLLVNPHCRKIGKNLQII